jgi:hypothetical protein
MSMGSARRGKVGNTGTLVATETMKKPRPSLSFTRSLLFVSAINKYGIIPHPNRRLLAPAKFPNSVASSAISSAIRTRLGTLSPSAPPDPAPSSGEIGRSYPRSTRSGPSVPSRRTPPRLLRLRPPPAASRGITSSAGFVCARPASTRRDPRAYRPRRSPLRRLI